MSEHTWRDPQAVPEGGGGDPDIGASHPQHLNELLDHILHFEKPIDDPDTVEWCRSLIGGGRDYDEFARMVKQYDSTAVCGLVWTADFMAYRCRTCQVRISNHNTCVFRCEQGLIVCLVHRSRLACHFAPSVSRTAIMRVTTSTCSSLKPVGPATAEISRS